MFRHSGRQKRQVNPRLNRAEATPPSPLNYSMWCPKCEAEYVSNITECPECRVRLVERLPEQSCKAQYIEYVELLTIQRPADLVFIKSILDSANITYYIKGEHTLNTVWWFHDAKLMVFKNHVDVARELLHDIYI